MTERATFTLDDEAFAFLEAEGGRNRSAFISRLLLAEKDRRLAEQIAAANLEEASDSALQDELRDWHAAIGDGL